MKKNARKGVLFACTQPRRQLFNAFSVIFIFLMVTVAAYSAPKNFAVRVAGKVVNEKGEPLAGATIMEKGTKTATSATNDGTFSINVSSNKAVLQVSFVGFETKEVLVGDATTNLVIQLTSITTATDAVIVVAYGTQRKISSTAAISTVKGEELAEAPVANFSNTIAGKLAGVSIRPNGGQPGYDNPDIHIRGIATTGNNGPLIVVDGVIRYNINEIDPQSIATFTVRSVGLDRREALWQVTSNDNPVGLFAAQLPEQENVVLPAMSASEHVVQDYASIALSLKAHPVSFVREKLQQLQITATGDLSKMQNGDPVRVAGIVLVRQRPGTAAGVCFITVEDETGVANCVVWASLFDEYRKPILQSRLLMVEGDLQVEGEVIHVIARSLHNLTGLLGDLTATNKEDVPVSTPARADETSMPATDSRTLKPKTKQQAVQVEMFPIGRNFK